MADLADIRIGIDVETGDVARAVQMFESFKRKTAQLKLEVNKGNITNKAYNRSVQQMAIRLGQVTGNANQAKSAMMKYQYAIKDATDEQLRFTTASGKGMRRMEILAQQAGYQIGDLAVQIQSGTNAAVAFGQQGSQLLGFFGPMGALAGAGLAITTGLVAPFFKAKDTAKKTEDAFRKIGEALDELESVTFDDNLRGGLLKTVKEIRGEFESSLKIVKELAAEQLKTEIKTPLKSLREQFLEYEKDKKLAYVEPDFNILGFEDPERFLQAFELLNQIQGDTREELQKSVDAAAFWLQGSGLLNQEVKKLLKGYIDIVGTVESVSKAVDTAKDNEKTGISETEKLRRKLAKERADTMEDFYKRRRKASLDAAAAEKKAEEDALKLYDDKYSKQDTINKLLFSEIKYGKDSAEYKALQNSLQDEQLKKEIELLKLSDTQKKSLVSLIDEQRRLLDKLDEEEEKRKRILKLTEEAASAYSKSKVVGIKADVFDPRGEAGITAVEAMRAGVQVFDYGKGDGTEPPKGKTPSTIEDNIKAMEREMEAERKLIGLEGERRRAQELYQELLYANQDADIKTTETRLRNLANQKAAQEEYIRKLDEEKQRQEDLANSIGSSFETALMSIVDGTKSVEDAFRTMAIEVIKELYRVLVVQKMVNAAKMAFGFADGGVIHNGSVVPYASGGVVGGPTYFPMSGGRTGLMGEAGPEAIMPLKRGKGGKLGVEVSGDTKPTVIHQNFNFAANGDESVKRMIAQAAPQIAKMTEKGIMDSRRRGGQMKAVFG